MTNKLSDKDKKDWQNFLDSSEKLLSKYFELVNDQIILERSIDLHGYNLEEANKKISVFIENCYRDKIKKVLDTWKFSKDSRSSNPNWLLIDTQA